MSMGGLSVAIRSNAQRRAVAKYNHANYEQIQIRVKTGCKAAIKALAEGQGESMNEFIVRAIQKTAKRDCAY